MKTLIGIVLAVLPVLAGCAPAPSSMELRLHLPDADVPLALDAAAEWTARTGFRWEPILLTPEGCAAQDCTFVDEVPRAKLDEGWPGGGCNDGFGAGCTRVAPDTWQAHVRIADDIRAREAARGHDEAAASEHVRVTILHELGHALGLDHDDARPVPSVMKASYDDDAHHLTGEDWWQYSRLRGGRP